MTQADDILDRTLRELIEDPILAHHFYVATGTDLGLSPDSVPAEVRGFEDLAFLFASNEFSMRAALLALDEAAYLYRLAGGASGGAVVEIGRYRGGTTFLLAAATRGRCRLYSYDKHVSMPWEPRFDGERADLLLRHALTRASVVDHVMLVVGDSATSEALPEPAHTAE
jgi:predicted O-methyltransferase YrrM